MRWFLVSCLVLCLAPRPALADAAATAEAFLAPLARVLATATPETEGLVRLRVTGEPAVVSAAAWDAAGNLRFPSPGGMGHVSDAAVLDDLAALERIMQGAGDGVWVASGLSPERLYFCRATDRICFVTDAIALAGQLGLPDAESVRAALVPGGAAPGGGRWVLPGLAAAAVLLLGAVAVSRGGAPRGPDGAVLPDDPDRFTLAGFVVSPRGQVAVHGTRRIDLTARDVKLLAHLARHRGEVVAKDTLYDVGWGRDFMPNSRALDQHIATLRRKLDPDRTGLTVIETVHGQGYRAPA